MNSTLESTIAKWFAMPDDVWQRHANPWSVWTRFTVLPFVIWGVWQLNIWPTIVGCIFVYAGKLWFLDRMVWIYEDVKGTNPEYTNGLSKTTV